jgi:uncharacterized protein
MPTAFDLPTMTRVTDSGLAAALCGLGADSLPRPDSTHSGALLESFVVGEICRQLTWSATEASLFHWRDRDGAEVDVVLERPTGEVVGIEVKAACKPQAQSNVSHFCLTLRRRRLREDERRGT